MAVFFLTLVFLLIVVAGMAIGVIFANKPIKGSCGGMAAIGMGGDCDICGGNTDKCEEENQRLENLSKLNSSSDSCKNYYNAAD